MRVLFDYTGLTVSGFSSKVDGADTTISEGVLGIAKQSGSWPADTWLFEVTVEESNLDVNSIASAVDYEFKCVDYTDVGEGIVCNP